eukprot:COSAG05_NODE_1621_length_4386_cov_3.207371_2_plen_97_part_00
MWNTGGFVGYSSVAKTMLCYSMGGRYHAGVFSLVYYFSFYVLFFALARFIPLPVNTPKIPYLFGYVSSFNIRFFRLSGIYQRFSGARKDVDTNTRC